MKNCCQIISTEYSLGTAFICSPNLVPSPLTITSCQRCCEPLLKNFACRSRYTHAHARCWILNIFIYAGYLWETKRSNVECFVQSRSSGPVLSIGHRLCVMLVLCYRNQKKLWQCARDFITAAVHNCITAVHARPHNCLGLHTEIKKVDILLLILW